MRDHHTRDLFDPLTEAPAGATLIPFPLKHAKGKARRVAETFLERKTDKGKQAYWARTIEQLERQLKKSGLDPETVEAQASAFREAVQSEIYRLEYEGQRPGGTA